MSLNAIDAGVVTTNSTAKFAKDKAPKLVKNTLTGVKHFGESGVKLVTDSRLGRWAGNKTGALIDKVRTGQVLEFNKKISKLGIGAGAIKSMSDLKNIDKITQLMILLIALLFFIIFFWCYNKLQLNQNNCKSLTNLYKNDFPLLSSINKTNPIYQYKLRDYTIKTAYNCCSAGNFKNDFVNLCALKNCIKQGARCLDFEIYSVHGVPVVAVSSKTDFNVKESYNSVSFSDAMTIISTYAFSGNTCPNPNDPLLLHFRIMSNNSAIYEQMATILYNTLESRLLGKQFSYENDGVNLGGYQLNLLMGKVIIMVDKKNPLYTSTTLYEYVNLASNAPWVRSMRYRDVIYCQDVEELKYYNKQQMTICLPDISATKSNYSADLVMAYGCQMIGMCFQNFDPYMQLYTQRFDDVGSAFILRDVKYRYSPIYIKAPPAQDPKLSYATKSIQFVKGLPANFL